MIALVHTGSYQLTETKADTKILKMDPNTYAWIKVDEIGEMLVWSEKEHKNDAILSSGEFRMYKVENEPDIVDLIHLELEAGIGQWQSYLLPTGLPNVDKKRSRIIPSKDLITKI